MEFRLKKYILVRLIVLFWGASNPVAAVAESQIALTAEATNGAIITLEAALKAISDNRVEDAQTYIDAARSAATDILGRCSVEAKKERGANALNNARRELKNGDAAAAAASLQEAIKVFNSLLLFVNNSQPPAIFR